MNDMDLRRVFLCDVDGVVADFTRHLLNCIGSPLSPQDITTWSLADALGDDYEKAKGVLFQEDFWITIPVIEGAQEGIARIKSRGHQVYWVTSPWYSCRTWAHARYVWIMKHFDDPPARVIITASKHLVRGSVFLDDKEEHLISHQQCNPRSEALLFDAPCNRKSTMRRVTWSTISGYLDAE